MKLLIDFLSDEGKTELASFYTDETKWELPNGYYDAHINALTDHRFNCPIYSFARWAAYSVNVSVYHINHQMTRHFASANFDYDLSNAAWMRSAHADELLYLFNTAFKFRNIFSKYYLPIWIGRSPRSSCNCGLSSRETARCQRKQTARNGPFQTEATQDQDLLRSIITL